MVFHGFNEPKGAAGLLGTGATANRAVLANAGQGTIKFGNRTLFHVRKEGLK
jgi:hypothetical protein